MASGELAHCNPSYKGAGSHVLINKDPRRVNAPMFTEREAPRTACNLLRRIIKSPSNSSARISPLVCTLNERQIHHAGPARFATANVLSVATLIMVLAAQPSPPARGMAGSTELMYNPAAYQGSRLRVIEGVKGA